MAVLDEPRAEEFDAAEPAEIRRDVRSRPAPSDRLFRGGVRLAAIAVLTLMALIGMFLLVRSWSALSVAGWHFITEWNWQPAAARFGIAGILPGTALIAAVAIAVAFPVSLGAALFISEYATGGPRRILISLIDLMAAVPSIVYGLWGFFFLQPRIIDLSRWASDHLSVIPLFRVDSPTYPASTFIAGVVVSLMVIPVITSIMREVFSQAPIGEREGAIALGATRWGVIRTVVLPFSKGGIIGGTMLGLGRALGETIAVFLIISPLFAPAGRLVHILQTGGISISALIAQQYGESNQAALSALLAAGLTLFLVTLVVNSLASVIVNRSRSGAATEI